MKKTINYLIIAIIILVLVIIGFWYWQYKRKYPSTDDAYIQAHVVNIAAQVNGEVKAVFVKDQQSVKKNQLLFTIDPTPFAIAKARAQAELANTTQLMLANQQAVATAKAQVEERLAQLKNARKNFQRISPLVKKGYYSKTSGDNAEQSLDVAKESFLATVSELKEARAKLGKNGAQNATIQAAKASVDQAELNLQYTNVYAPADGYVANFNLQPGQTLTAFETLFSIVESHQWWAIANMKETDLARIKPGQSAKIEVDMYPNVIFKGVVGSISAGSGTTFALLPPENATGNWVKVVQRFPVKIDMPSVDDATPLRVGASASVTIDTTHER